MELVRRKKHSRCSTNINNNETKTASQRAVNVDDGDGYRRVNASNPASWSRGSRRFCLVSNFESGSESDESSLVNLSQSTSVDRRHDIFLISKSLCSAPAQYITQQYPAVGSKCTDRMQRITIKL